MQRAVPPSIYFAHVLIEHSRTELAHQILEASASDRLITQPTEIFNHRDTCFFFSSSGGASAAIIIYYVVKHIVEQRNGTKKARAGSARHIERVDRDAAKKGGRRVSRPVIDRVYRAKPLPTPRINV